MSRSVQHASSLLALCLLAGSGWGQQLTTNSFEAFCKTLSGNAGAETVCEGFEFSDGTIDLSAGLAVTNKSDADNSLWRMTDGVRMASGMTEILAEKALVRFEADEPALIELSGNPVVMSDYIVERETAVRGTALGISYDSLSGDVRLTGQATLTIGENEVTGCEWVYNVIDNSWEAGATDECDEGIRLLLAPPEESDDPDGQPETP